MGPGSAAHREERAALHPGHGILRDTQDKGRMLRTSALSLSVFSRGFWVSPPLPAQTFLFDALFDCLAGTWRKRRGWELDISKTAASGNPIVNLTLTRQSRALWPLRHGRCTTAPAQPFKGMRVHETGTDVSRHRGKRGRASV